MHKIPELENRGVSDRHGCDFSYEKRKRKRILLVGWAPIALVTRDDRPLRPSFRRNFVVDIFRTGYTRTDAVCIECIHADRNTMSTITDVILLYPSILRYKNKSRVPGQFLFGENDILYGSREGCPPRPSIPRPSMAEAAAKRSGTEPSCTPPSTSIDRVAAAAAVFHQRRSCHSAAAYKNKNQSTLLLPVVWYLLSYCSRPDGEDEPFAMSIRTILYRETGTILHGYDIKTYDRDPPVLVYCVPPGIYFYTYL